MKANRFVKLLAKMCADGRDVTFHHRGMHVVVSIRKDKLRRDRMLPLMAYASDMVFALALESCLEEWESHETPAMTLGGTPVYADGFLIKQKEL